MKLSEHIAEMQRLLERHGDLEVYRNDSECSPYVSCGITVERLLDGRVVYEYEHENALKNIKTEAEQMAVLDDIWCTLTPKLQRSWKSRENYDEQMSVSYDVCRRIAAEWDNLPLVAIIV